VEKPVVLIVEDEALIRMNARQMLEDAGYEVLDSCDADEAIRILESRNDIRAVFTDITMPGSMDGWKLAHAIRGRWPPIHLIVTSGLKVPDGGILPTNGRFIPKPYSDEQLTAAFRELFEEQLVPATNNQRGLSNRDKLA
jgi:CheY-like chemotaxis protein